MTSAKHLNPISLCLVLASCGAPVSTSKLNPAETRETCEVHHVYTNSADEVDAYQLANMHSLVGLKSKNPYVWAVNYERYCSQFSPYGNQCISWANGVPASARGTFLYGPYRSIPAGGTVWAEVKLEVQNVSGIEVDFARDVGRHVIDKVRLGPGTHHWISRQIPVGNGLNNLEVRAFSNDVSPGTGSGFVEIREIRIVHRRPNFLADQYPHCK